MIIAIQKSQRVLWRGGMAALAALIALLWAGTLLAHQPFFEEDDLTPTTPLRVADPQVSTALYATLDRVGDVDYFVFNGAAGVGVEMGMTIPQIPGQAEFAPTVAVIGPGLPTAEAQLLPDDETRQLVTGGDGVYLLSPGTVSSFYEPFSRTSYWRRQSEKVTLPADGVYTLAVWSADNRVGRYVLVVGDREIPGGDLTFPMKLPVYWTPVDAPGATVESGVVPTQQPAVCGWLERLLAHFSARAKNRCAF